MIMKANKQIGFININEESIDKILKDGEVVFERGFLREKTSTTLPITFGGVGKDLKDYKIYGNTYQNSTRGVNLFNHYLYPANTTYNGITITNNGDGSFTLNGTCTTNNSSFALGPDTKIKELANEGQVTQTAYYISGTCTKGSSSNARTTIRLNYDTGYTRMIPLQNLSTQGIISKTHPQDSRETGWSWRISLDAGDAFDNFTIKYQLEKGSEATDYEPYTGGQPSPNPDYPQEIISVGDLITDTTDVNYGKYKIPVNVRSDNLFDKDNANILNAAFSDNGKKVSSSQNGRTLYIKCKPNTTYTVTKKARERFRLLTTETLPSIDVVGNNYQFGDTNSVLTIETTSNDNYLCVYYYLYGTDTLTEQQILDSIMIVEGSTAPSKYIPYYNQTTNIYLDEPLRKIDGYSDYIDFINGKVVRRIKETLLDDNITWTTGRFAIEKRIYTSSSNIDSNMRAVNSNSQVGYLLSNQYKAEKLENILALSVRNGIGISSTSYFSILNQDYASATDFLQALHDNPIVLDYALITPTEESITLPNIPTIEGNNTLNIETEITPSQVYIKYKSNT